tara:strand:+ start:185 stop:346 length:162 start_codon:yes stop_codon:yes gene_type:complete
MNKDTTQLIEEYVYKNYKSYKGKELVIRDFGSHYRIYKHETGSPLILSKEIIK